MKKLLDTLRFPFYAAALLLATYVASLTDDEDDFVS